MEPFLVGFSKGTILRKTSNSGAISGMVFKGDDSSKKKTSNSKPFLQRERLKNSTGSSNSLI
jgi:hypothetical protein